MSAAAPQVLNADEALYDELLLGPDQPTPFITGGLEQRGVSSLPVLLG